MWKDIHILLLGEPQVGKTSLILSLVSEEFPEDVPCRVEEITIPADVTPEKVPTYIVDYSEADQAEYKLCEEVARANVVCLVYDLTDLGTLHQVRERWLPLVREYSMHDTMLPVILVGNKSDLITDTKMYEIMPLMNDFPEIETCIECSSKTLNNVSEMFYFAQKAVLHPTGPLYSPNDGYLKPESKIALTRIFNLCDKDNDGLLNDKELANFQKICFSTPLATQALQDVKNVVKKNCPDGVIEDSLTVDGFLYLHLLFIQRGRHETTWAVLRKFGYNDNLTMSDEYIVPDTLLPPQDATPQLTADAREFLVEIFIKYDRDEDGALNQQEMDKLFSVFPYEPWGADVLNTVCTNDKGYITLKGFLSQWMLTTYLDVPRTLEYLGYLGYSTLCGKISQMEGIAYIPNNSQENEKGHLKDIFTCKVVGARGVGKTAFLQGLLERDAETKNSKAQVSVLAINEIAVKGRAPVYLLLHEVEITEVLAAGEGLFMCDSVCLLYDVTDANSFQHCIELYKKYVVNSNVSCFVVAMKADCSAVRQHCTVQPEDFCERNNLPLPKPYSSQTRDLSVYEQIADLTASPNSLCVPKQNVVNMCIKIGLFAAVCMAAGYGIYKYSRGKVFVTQYK
uniref:Mitochondrial Rho GTPase n=1 Tax=Phallusia mammillata TaxID=59560 RepID=A0A6F9DRE9_9ASCI|nr:mitochondrial Rho GTPase 1-like [Phallusia mammillata]